MAVAKLAESTKKNYLMRVNQYVKEVKMGPDEFVRSVKARPKKFEESFIEFLQATAKRSSPSTTMAYRDSLKRFLEINRVRGIDWDYVGDFVPSAKKAGQDRAPTLEEIQRIVDVSDLRMRCLVLFLCSTGARIGSIPYLKWSDVEGVEVEEKKFAKVTIYRNEPEAYITFMTPESYGLLLEYRKLREGIGEHVTAASHVFVTQGNARDFDPAGVRQVSINTLKNQLGKLLENLGMRTAISQRGRYKTYEFKQAHGFRKFFKTRMEVAGVKPLAVETMMGHNTGLARSYYKPTAGELANEYSKAIDELTIVRPQQSVAKDAILATIRKEMLIGRYSEVEIGKIGDLSKLTNEQMVELLNRRAQPAAPKVAGTGSQRVVPASDVKGMIEQGWEYLTKLPDGYVVMKLPKP